MVESKLIYNKHTQPSEQAGAKKLRHTCVLTNLELARQYEKKGLQHQRGSLTTDIL